MFYILIVCFVSSSHALPVCFTTIIIFILFVNVHLSVFILFKLHPNPANVNTPPKGPDHHFYIYYYYCMNVFGHGAFHFYCHSASNILHRSLVSFNAPNTCFHIANIGFTIPLHHMILCIGCWD